MCAVAKKDNTRNKDVRGSVQVAQLTNMIIEKLVKWYRHVKRREEEHALRRTLDAQNQERDDEEDRTPGGRHFVKDTWKCRVNDGFRIGQENAEETNTKPFRRPHMMRKAREVDGQAGVLFIRSKCLENRVTADTFLPVHCQIKI